MKTKNKWRVVHLCAGVVCLLISGSVAPVTAQEKKEIPDHAPFQSCQACHAEKLSMWEASNHPKAIGLISIINPAATECGSCHASKSLASAQPASAAVAAPKESYHKVSCLACHARQKSENDHRLVMAPEKLCDLCHTQRTIFLGKGAKGIEDSRNFHSGVPCVSCHMTEGNHRMKVLRPDDAGLTEKRLDTCTACHKDNNREARVEQIQEWQSTYAENMNPLLADIKAIEEKLKTKPDLLSADLKSKFDDVKANLSILEKDGSRGFHNFVFSLEVTSLAADALKEIKASVK
jgi:predicted CXXCH cytochrome family protein